MAMELGAIDSQMWSNHGSVVTKAFLYLPQNYYYEWVKKQKTIHLNKRALLR